MGFELKFVFNESKKREGERRRKKEKREKKR